MDLSFLASHIMFLWEFVTYVIFQSRIFVVCVLSLLVSRIDEKQSADVISVLHG